jgi:hypothetical protein
MSRCFFEVDLSVFEKDGAIVGFGLIAQPHTESEIFCGRFPRLINGGDKAAKIIINGKQLIFSHHKEGVCTFTLPEEVACAIAELLASDVKDTNFLTLSGHGFLTPGFKLIRSGVEDAVERELTSSRI